MNLTVHIERLVLDGAGLGGAQPHLLQAVIQVELARLLGEGGLAPELAAGVALPHVAGLPLALPSDAGGAEAGARIAASVYGGIGRPRP